MQGRKALPVPQPVQDPTIPAAFDRLNDSAAQLAVIEQAQQQAADTLAIQFGYEGAVTVGRLEDEIRFYQVRTVEMYLEVGKRLLLLKELTAHGEFERRVELLGFSTRSARKFMQVTARASKTAAAAVLAGKVKNVSVLLEFMAEDDEVLEKAVAELDDIDRMTREQARAAVRELRAEAAATGEVLAKKNERIDRLEREKKLLAKLPPDERLLALQKEATAVMHDALGCIRGGLRAALGALGQNGSEPDVQVFAAGLVGQLTAELAELRRQFNLPDVSNARDQELMAKVEQWAGPLRAKQAAERAAQAGAVQ